MEVNDEGYQIFNRFYSFNTIDELTYAYSLNSTLDNGFFITELTTYLGSKFDLNIIAIKTDSLGNTMVSINNSVSVAQKEFILYQNYPNPFNPVTNIEFQIPEKGFVSLKVYDVLGKEVMKLVNEMKQAGDYKVDFNTVNFTSGIYFYKFEYLNFVQTKRMILIK